VLHSAAIDGKEEVCKMLVEQGSFNNHQDFQNKTPLDFAILYNRSKTVSYLRSIGSKTKHELLIGK
jgi:ankyrin repeat protein